MPHAFLSDPVLYPSQLKYRLGLTKKRLVSYPVDSMNFVMMDLERPFLRTRHADFCTTDLTGRLLQFYSCIDGVDGEHIEPLTELFERIMNNRKSSGGFSNFYGRPPSYSPETVSIGGHFLAGLVKYYDLTGDMRALNAAIEIAETPIDHLYSPEGYAELYRVTRDKKYLEAVRSIARSLRPASGSHTHSYLTALRGILKTGIASDNEELIEIARQRRQEIIDCDYILPNGDVPEGFPMDKRNEGCSIADWIMLNLIWAHYSGDTSAYELAEHSLWNALYFNQFVTGGFGHRFFLPHGYRTYIEEAWWCCTTTAGMCMAEVARHTVTLRDGKLCLNFFVPGKYTLKTDRGEITVSVTTSYPVKARTIVKVVGTKEDIDIRVPDFIKGLELRREEDDMGYTVYLNGKMGHYTEVRKNRRIVKYGPLVIAPMTYFWNMDELNAVKNDVPEGYQHENVGAKKCLLDLPRPDADGFYTFANNPKPEWIVFEEGEMASIGGGEVAAVNVPVILPHGEKDELYFQPLCSATSNLTLMDIISDFDL
ncbi:MAG: glycoside hydrolase family 127 protein [Clostridia bacterium]|nr:glycoside hydrolase family 127 protein [Clostridia bacterium]